MTPVFDSNSDLVAWFDGQHLFNTNMDWIAFSTGGHVFSSSTGNWLGAFNDGSMLDTNGKPVAWLQNVAPSGTMAPMRPMRPMQPMSPMRPMTPMTPMRPMQPMQPMGGWSSLNFSQWLSA